MTKKRLLKDDILYFLIGLFLFVFPVVASADYITFDNSTVYFSGLWLHSSGYTYYTIQDNTGTCESGTLYSTDTTLDFLTSACHTYFNSAIGNYIQISTGNEEVGNPYYQVTFVHGCRDESANNYQGSDWTVDTGPCTYDEEPPATTTPPMATSSQEIYYQLQNINFFLNLFYVTVVLSAIFTTKIITRKQ